MAIRFRCCECSKLLSIGTRKAGTATPCPVCGTSQIVPPASASRRSHRTPSTAPQSRPIPVFSLGVGILIILGSLVGIHAIRQQSQAHSPEAAPTISALPPHVVPVEQQILAAVKLTPNPAATLPAKLVPTVPVAHAKPAETPAQPAAIETVQAASAPAPLPDKGNLGEPAAGPLTQIAKNEEPGQGKPPQQDDACPRCDPSQPKDAQPVKGIQIVDQPARQTDRETFGTAVEFARNPVEAGKLAKEERKLAFLLHVSGNFEDAGFT